MSKRPRPPDDLPAGNGQAGSAAAARPPADACRDTLPALLASHWAIILKRFRDYIHQR